MLSMAYSSTIVTLMIIFFWVLLMSVKYDSDRLFVIAGVGLVLICVFHLVGIAQP